jgi:deferrochelatase/peroxidase EfeB
VDVNRRNFLKGTAAGAAGTALVGGVLIGGAHADADASTQASGAAQADAASYPFHGARQSGVLTPGPSGKQPFTCVAAFDSMAQDKAALTSLLQTITTRARFLTTGGTPPNLGISQPPSDSDVLGPVVPADGLTMTVSVGSTLFDDRYGLSAAKPMKLKPRRHAVAVEDGGLQLAAPAVGHGAQPARVQGRHRQPDGQPRHRPGLGR